MWWIVLLLVPFLDVVIGFVIVTEVARRFGRGTGFTLGLVLLSFLFRPILGFGSAEYQTIDYDDEGEDDEKTPRYA